MNPNSGLSLLGNVSFLAIFKGHKGVLREGPQQCIFEFDKGEFHSLQTCATCSRTLI